MCDGKHRGVKAGSEEWGTETGLVPVIPSVLMVGATQELTRDSGENMVQWSYNWQDWRMKLAQGMLLAQFLMEGAAWR